MSTPPAPEHVLAAEDLAYAVDGLAILGGISLSLQPGEVLGLIGPNGSGKTTLLRALTRLVPAEGRVWLGGEDVGGLDARVIARLAARVPQAAAHDGGFTAEEVVLTGRTPHLGRFAWETAADRRIARRAMADTGTERLAERLAADLSGGERQRVFLARALAQEGRVLLLDEPTASLDVGHQVAVLGLVRRLALREGLAAIAAIHDLELAARFCDRLVLLHAGRVVAEGPPATVLTPEHLARAYGVQAIVEPNPHVSGLRITVLGPAPGDGA